MTTPAPAGGPALTAIVPATNSPATLEACVEAISSAHSPPEQVVVVETPVGAGPAAARNAGALQAHGDVLVFVDADVLVHADAFTRIRAVFAADPGLTALFGSYDAAPAAPGRVSAFRNLLHHHVHQSSPGPASTFWAGLGAVRREPFAAVAGFDAVRFPKPSVEDIELGLRLAAAGRRVVLDPELQGTHLKRWTLLSMLRTDFGSRGVPWVRLLLEQGRGSTALNLGWAHRVSAALALAATAAAIGRRPRAAAAALAGLVVLNRSFYALLWRVRGPGEATLGVPLHVAHHLAAIAAVPVGSGRHARAAARARR